MKITLSAQSWQEKWQLISSYMEEKLLFILPSNSTNAHREDQGAGIGKHPLHSAEQCGSRTLGPELRSKALQSSFSCHIDKFEGNLSSAIAQTRKNPWQTRRERKDAVCQHLNFFWLMGTVCFSLAQEPWITAPPKTLWIRIVTFSKD